MALDHRYSGLLNTDLLITDYFPSDRFITRGSSRPLSSWLLGSGSWPPLPPHPLQRSTTLRCGSGPLYGVRLYYYRVMLVDNGFLYQLICMNNTAELIRLPYSAP